MKLVRTLLAASLLFSASMAMADTENSTTPSFFDDTYVEINLGSSTDFRNNSVAGASFDRYRFAGNINAVKNMGTIGDSFWGFEMGYSYLPGAKLDIGGVTTLESTNHVFDFAGMIFHPMGANGAYGVYAKLGPAFVYNQVELAGKDKQAKGALALFGALGAYYNLDEPGHWDAHIQLSGVSNSESTDKANAAFDALGMKKDPALMMVSAGIGYTFF